MVVSRRNVPTVALQHLPLDDGYPVSLGSFRRRRHRMGADNKTVIVNGPMVMEYRRFTSHGDEGLSAEVRDDVPRFEAKDPDSIRLAFLNALKPYFHAWHGEVLSRGRASRV
jgi:hypothetical protein